MEILLLNTSHGLIPIYDDDFDKKKQLKVGESYKCKITKARNIQFHKLYFALINCSWQYLNEATQSHYKNSVEQYRKSVEVTAGHCDTVFNITLKSWVDIPKSIAFDKMDELEFKDLYERVKDVIFLVFLKNITMEEFENNLVNF